MKLHTFAAIALFSSPSMYCTVKSHASHVGDSPDSNMENAGSLPTLSRQEWKRSLIDRKGRAVLELLTQARNFKDSGTLALLVNQKILQLVKSSIVNESFNKFDENDKESRISIARSSQLIELSAVLNIIRDAFIQENLIVKENQYREFVRISNIVKNINISSIVDQTSNHIREAFNNEQVYIEEISDPIDAGLTVLSLAEVASLELLNIKFSTWMELGIKSAKELAYAEEDLNRKVDLENVEELSGFRDYVRSSVSKFPSLSLGLRLNLDPRPWMLNFEGLGIQSSKGGVFKNSDERKQYLELKLTDELNNFLEFIACLSTKN